VERKSPNLWAYTDHGLSVVIYVPRGVLRISSVWDDRMGAKIHTQKIPLGPNKTPKYPCMDQKLTPKKSHAEFLSLKNF